MNILLLGSGGREHALAWSIAKSRHTKKLFIAPGNPGTAEIGSNISLDVTDHPAVIAFCHENAIDLVVVGPEAPLVAGIVDDLSEADIPAFGPRKAPAQLEGSKSFTKALCDEFNIPTAAYARFTEAEPALHYIRARGAPIVVKADGLAAGKGVVVAETIAEAEDAIRMIFSGQFGAAGAAVVIEDFLTGEEASFFALSDGETAIALASAQDHKRVFDGDTGPNTGGMGAYSPAPVVTPEIADRVMREIINPTVAGLKARGTPYQGVLYAGLMIGKDGPKLIEYNARFGDPECQVLMPRLESDVVELLMATVEGRLATQQPVWRDDAALTVVMAARGYPGDVEKGSRIRNIDAANAIEGVTVFHAGTREVDGEIVANGGRVLTVTAIAPTIRKARAHAYEAVNKIDWPEGFSRTDIGWRAIARENG